MCITIVCYPGCDVIKLEINRIFLIKPFCFMKKKSRQKLKYPENEKSFWMKWKAFFIIFKGLWVAKNCFRPESLPSNNYEKCFSFHLKTFFLSRDIQIFVFPTSPQFFPVSHWLKGWFKINLKAYNVSICLNKNLITHFNWYLEKGKIYDIETFSIERVLRKEHFHGKIMLQLCTKRQSKAPSQNRYCMEEIVLKIRCFERGSSKCLKKVNVIFPSQFILMNKIMKNKKSLKLVTSHSSGHKISSDEFLD